MGRLGSFVSFFRNSDEENQALQVALSRSALDWMSQDYHAKFEAWLEENASVDLNPGWGEAQLRNAVVRANTFREIRKHLQLIRKSSEAAIQREREEAQWVSTTLTD